MNCTANVNTDEPVMELIIVLRLMLNNGKAGGFLGVAGIQERVIAIVRRAVVLSADEDEINKYFLMFEDIVLALKESQVDPREFLFFL